MNDTEQMFFEELNQLLRMYHVELSVDQDNNQIRAWAYTQWNKHGQIISDRIDLNLGSWFNGE